MKKLPCIVLFLLSTLVSAQAQISGPKPDFRVFDTTLYHDKPDLGCDGLSPITMIYTITLWSHEADRADVPNPDVIRALALQALQAPGSMAIIDIENWPLKGDPAVVADSVRKYVTTLRQFKRYSDKLKVGYFAVAPGPNPPAAIRAENSLPYRNWQAVNDSAAPIARAADMLFPQLYTDNKDQHGWQQVAIASIREARRIGMGKPVYVFLWPQYYVSGKGSSGGDYLPPAFWRMELETARKYADGVVIWGGWQQEWDANAPWWRETQEFMKELNGRQ